MISFVQRCVLPFIGGAAGRSRPALSNVLLTVLSSQRRNLNLVSVITSRLLSAPEKTLFIEVKAHQKPRPKSSNECNEPKGCATSPAASTSSQPKNNTLPAANDGVVKLKDDLLSTLKDAPEPPQTTGGEFVRLVRRYSHCLTSLGVCVDDRVMVHAPKTVDVVALYMATLQLGAIFVPINFDYTPMEVEYFIGNATPKLLMSSSTANAATNTPFHQHSNKITTVVSPNALRAMVDESSETLRHIETRSPDQCAVICYTSGTTGKPKGAMLSQGNLLSNARSLLDLWCITADDTLLHCLPISHVHGLLVALNTALIAGSAVVLCEKFQVDTVLEWLPKCTVLMGVPTHYTRLLNDGRINKATTADVRLLVCGSAPLLPETWKRFAEVTGKDILERYGMTEGLIIASNPYEGVRKCGTVGFPLPDVEVRIQNGHLQYRGPNVFTGYWMDEQKTKEEFTDDGFFKSGDLAEWDSDGYLRIFGRSKDLIISGGLNVYPKEIEEVLDAHPDVLESAVIGLPDADFGESVCAVIVPRVPVDNRDNTASDVIGDDVITAFAAQLPLAKFKLPKRVFFVDALPRNAMGKVQKNVLKQRYAGGETSEII